MTTTVTSREFNQNRARVKSAAERGPVIVTDRGKPSLAVLRFEDYERLMKPRIRLADALYMPGADEVEFEIPARTDYAPDREFEFD